MSHESTGGKIPCRKAFTQTLLELASADPTIFAVTSDARGSVTLGDFADRLPRQFVETGIAEQNSIGVAAGLANMGKRPFVCGPASFYSSRALEQLKNDLAYSKANVKVIGVSGGVSYGALGSTHHSLYDLAVMRAIPDLTVVLPADVHQTRRLTHALAAHVGPVYVRMGRGPVPDVYAHDDCPFTIGKANVLREGRDVTLVGAGETVHRIIAAAELLAKRGVSARVIDSHTIKPIDAQTILAAARETRAIVTVEEHSIYGGLGGAVAELVVQHTPVPMRIMGFPDEDAIAGSSDELFEHYGLSPASIADAASELLRSRSS